MKAILATALLALPWACLAQDITGSIVGTVTDQTGAAVPGAKITITNMDRNAIVRTTVSSKDGDYVAALLDVGKYSITVEAKGFKKSTQTNITLNVNDKLTVNTKLEIGDVQQEITIESGITQQVALQSAEQSTTVNGAEIRELALITRNYEQLVSMMPGVSAASTDQLYVGVSLPSGSTATIPFSINGARNSMNAWLVDGADNVDRGSNQTLLNTPSIDAIEEFKVSRSGYAAEMGRAGGAQISVVTKSGTKDFHGDLYEFVRNSDFAANNFFANATSQNLGANGKSQVAPLHYNNFGWTVGGPVVIPHIYNGAKRDRHQTYFFVSEEFRRVITYATGTAVLPTSGELSGTFAHPVCVQYTGNTCNQTTTQVANIDPVAREYIKDIFSKLPLSASSTSVTSLFRNVYDFEQELYKVDHIFSPKLQVSGRFLRDSIPTTEPQGLFTGSPVPGVPTTNTNAPGHNWTFRGTSTFTPTLLNEAGYNYSYGAIISDPVGLINSTISSDIKPTLPFTSTLSQVPGLSFASGTGITGFGPYRDYNRNNNFYDNVTKIRGSHTFKAGLTYNHYQKTENAAGGNAGSFTFTPASVPTGTTQYEQAFANFLVGNVASFSQASQDVTPDVRAQQWEIYAQDDWRIKSNFTLNLGVRYSMFRQPIDAKNELSNFDPATFSASAVPALTAGGLLATIPSISYLNGIIVGGKNSPFGSKVSNEDNGNIAPRFGFAWDPFKNGKTAIRGGYGIYYDATLYGTFEQNIFANPPFVNTVSIPNVSLDNPAGGTATVNNSPKIPHGTPYDFKTPYTQQWSFELQRQVMKDTILNVGYVGTKGTHLLGIVDLNSVQPGLAYSSGLLPTTTAVTSANTPVLNLIRPYGGYSSISQIVPWFNSNYHSLQVSGQKRFQSDSQVNFAYTWSKNLTDAQTDRSSAPQNVYNFHEGEYGPAQFDRRHVFSANVIYTLPFMKSQQGFTGKLLGGWQISAFANYSTGLPFTVTTTGVDPAALGIIPGAASGRPDLTCDPYAGVTSSRLSWFNTACFPLVPAGVHLPGNEGRGVLRGPGYENWNMAASKNLVFRERFRFQLRGEASNVFNHTNPSTFGSTTNTSTLFGTITGYRDPRIIQLGAKLYF
jgi:hypothetical protein